MGFDDRTLANADRYVDELRAEKGLKDGFSLVQFDRGTRIAWQAGARWAMRFALEIMRSWDDDAHAHLLKKIEEE